MKKLCLVLAVLFCSLPGFGQIASEVQSQVGASAGLVASADLPMFVNIHEQYTVENRRCSDGNYEAAERPEGAAYHCWTAWTWTGHNLTTTQGLNDLLDKYFKGSTYTATWYCGLVDNANFTTYAAGNTAGGITLNASGSNQWQEADDYSNANRPTITLGTVSGGSVDNSASKCVFNINGTATIRGAFVVSTNTIGGTTGFLYGVADFSAARSVLSGDTLNVTTTLTAS